MDIRRRADPVRRQYFDFREWKSSRSYSLKRFTMSIQPR